MQPKVAELAEKTEDLGQPELSKLITDELEKYFPQHVCDKVDARVKRINDHISSVMAAIADDLEERGFSKKPLMPYRTR